MLRLSMRIFQPKIYLFKFSAEILKSKIIASEKCAGKMK